MIFTCVPPVDLHYNITIDLSKQVSPCASCIALIATNATVTSQ